MKRIGIALAYLTVINTLSFAQQSPILSVVAETNLPSITATTPLLPTPNSAVHNMDEYAPLSNCAFFPGGQQRLATYFKNPDLYPVQARRADVEGTVWVQFRVQPSGNLSDIRVINARRSLLSTVAIEAVSLMPPWYPAHRNGEAVVSTVVLPITFKMD
jgi:periplasmic protein TonB